MATRSVVDILKRAIDKSLSAVALTQNFSYTNTQPPPFGHQLLDYFSFDPGYVNLNSGLCFLISPWPVMLIDSLGSYGSVPAPVIQACTAMTDEVEGSPDKFMRLKYPTFLNTCRERVARLIGAHVDECVLVPNAIHQKKGRVIIFSAILFVVVPAIRTHQIKQFSSLH